MSFTKLPKEYESIKKINLAMDKKSAIIIQVISAFQVSFLLVCGAVYYGQNKLENLLLTEQSSELWNLIGKVVFIAFICFLYVQLREGINVFLMKAFCKESKISLNFKAFFTDATSDAYYSRKDYIFISIAPFIFLGLIFYIISSVVPIEWFWTVYIVQIINLASASGDVYMLVLLLSMPKDILVKESGATIEIFGR